MSYNKNWCCKNIPNIWEIDEQDPPCHICPNNLTLTDRNRLAFQAFQDLDTSGRDVGFDIGHLREEAIDVYLNRFECNTPEIYTALVSIDRKVTVHRRTKAEAKRTKQQKKTSQPRVKRGRR